MLTCNTWASRRCECSLAETTLARAGWGKSPCPVRRGRGKRGHWSLGLSFRAFLSTLLVLKLLKIFLLKPSSLGDVVQALPVLRLLKRGLPESEIFWWLDSGLVPLLQDDPDIAGIIPFERERWRSPRFWLEPLQSLRDIRGR